MAKKPRGRPRKRKGPRGAFAEGLRAARRSLGLTQAEAAKVLQVSLPTIARWEAGTKKPRGPALAFVQGWIEQARRNGGRDGG